MTITCCPCWRPSRGRCWLPPGVLPARCPRPAPGARWWTSRSRHGTHTSSTHEASVCRGFIKEIIFKLKYVLYNFTLNAKLSLILFNYFNVFEKDINILKKKILNPKPNKHFQWKDIPRQWWLVCDWWLVCAWRSLCLCAIDLQKGVDILAAM